VGVCGQPWNARVSRADTVARWWRCVSRKGARPGRTVAQPWSARVSRADTVAGRAGAWGGETQSRCPGL